jgi:hypothetical protein
MTKKSKVKVEGNTISGTAEDIVDVLKSATDKITSNGKYSKIQLKKAKIKDSLFLEVEYSETIADGTNTVKKDCTAPVHDDLKNAFAELDDHLSRICEQWTTNNRFDETQCKGFTIGGSGDNEGVTLIGSREIKYGVLNIVSPFTKWDSEYENIIELGEAIETCKHEVKLYLFEGKHQPAQQKLPFEDIRN